MIISRLFTRLISKLKGEDYQVSYEFGLLEFCEIFFTKFFQIIRGYLFIKLYLQRSNGFVFSSSGAKVRFGKKVICGKNMTLGRNSLINALCKNGVQIGDNFMLGDSAIIECTGVLKDVGEGIRIGNNVAINHYCFIGVRGTIEIGNNVIFGPRVSVFSENHNFHDPLIPIKNQGVTRRKTKIGNDVWIGSGSSIMAGVEIGEGSVIASGSVVTKNIQPFTVVGGVPAKEIKKRKQV